MPTATTRAPGSTLVVPPTQNTAPVLEFNCLYTHDIRRKSKRWQDGFMRLHTFNKRVMVYDIPRNYIGDTHLTGSGDLNDGDEIRLDKGAVLVQVLDQVGQTETDLTVVLKNKASTHNPASSSPLRLVSPLDPPRTATRQPLQDRHRSLNALLGPDRTPIGKAVLPSKTPYEIRRAQQSEWAEQPATKRRRTDAGSPKQRANHPTVDAMPQTLPAQPEVVDLCSEDEDESPFSSMVLAPRQPSPIRPTKQTQKRADLLPPVKKPSVETSIVPAERPDAISRPPEAARTSMSIPQHSRAQEKTVKRLKMAKAPVKKSTLACMSTTVDDADLDLEAQQRRRLEERLARLASRASVAGPEVVLKPQSVPSRRLSPQKEFLKSPVKTTSTTDYDTDFNEEDMAVAVAQHDMLSTRELEAEALAIESTMHDEDIPEDAEPTGHRVHQNQLSPLVQRSDDDDMTAIPAPDVDATSEDLAALDGLIEVEEHQLQKELNADLEALDDNMDVDDSVEQLPGALPMLPSDEPYVESVVDDEIKLDTHANPPSKHALPMVEGVHDESVDDPHIRQSCETTTAFVPANLLTVGQQPPQEISEDAVTPKTSKPPAKRRRHGVGRIVVRNSAAACFKPPTLSARISNPSSVQSAQSGSPAQCTHGMTSTLDSGPWSREAFDLFVWRPPNWDDDKWSGVDEPAIMDND